MTLSFPYPYYYLWWFEGDTCDAASIDWGGGATPVDLVEPVIKVFEDDAQETCYLYCVDRYCISDANPYEITFDPGDMPSSADCSPWLLDRSRRFIMEGTWDGHADGFLRMAS